MQDPGCSKKPAHLHISTGSVVSVAILFSSSSFFFLKAQTSEVQRTFSMCLDAHKVI